GGRERAIGPAVGVELVRRAVDLDPLGELREQQLAPDRWVERRDQQTVIAAREDPGGAARGVAADPIRDDPLETRGAFRIAQHVAAIRALGHGHTPPCGRALELRGPGLQWTL